ncbi:MULTISPECIES: hydroxylamine reductase [unclassified Novosphingobium]|uniref:hydroxylamine reductase n=1 Tax=unclassified Novosphingobium TaxID=2644732 RepID=UPI00086BAF48|nr:MULTISPECIES: hydroxylamine reductase [unclassified Novosphingobium]MBN9146020.1 hydroxylamine reductase [Novosphingobium sp.]MDR6709439.1 hydroxylamine reductase [Novosphingobium sp. 1748]ODU79388.1 MAG: hydroxylamine reductase [Novosphingobium sp. SCN 63-17]OJX94117.1 MAG: hydroxylamine reductase [Novosphingobium sp. 63-713]
MYCVQCEQSNKGGCAVKVGSCGKSATVADMQDVLLRLMQGVSAYADRAAAKGARDEQVDAFTPHVWFTTLTNVNFDAGRFDALITQALEMRERAKACAIAAGADLSDLPEPATWNPGANAEEWAAAAPFAAIQRFMDRDGPSITGLRNLILYGLKGTAAYSEHARVLDHEEAAICAEFHRISAFLAGDPTDMAALIAQSLAVGAMNLKVMELLDAANTTRFGHPEVTMVRMTPVQGKALLVSGHDMGDLEAILQQTEGKGINVYTHGELMPANAYPGLKKYAHLVGNYGGAWQDQQRDFDAFPGAIVMTSNCLINPEIKGYADRIFTAGPVGWAGIPHLTDHDFAPAIACALAQPGFAEDAAEQRIPAGFARNTVMGVADTLLDMIGKGDVKNLFLIGGCDGARPGRNYFHDLAVATPKDSLVLTLGCGKFRFNREDMGDINGVPRVLDMGQCNDAFSAIQVAVAVAGALGCGVNDLPLHYAISWFEQKATAVLLTMLHLGIRKIHLGPTLPQFLTPEVLGVLVENFDIRPTGEAKEDLARMLQAA